MNNTIVATEANVIGPIMTLSEIGKQKPPFELAPLPYKTNALAPFIDEKTMEIHHGMQHLAYVENLNKLAASNNEKLDLQTILTKVSAQGAAIRNSAGGHWNHTFFWQVLTGDSEKQKIPERLGKEIEKHFGSVDKFKEAFEKAATAQFGSGWAWLIRDNAGKLAITTTGNQDNPLMDTAKEKGRPIFAIDLWEHAYYLSYQNKRADYLKNIWKVVNWAQVDAYDREVSAH